MTISVAKAMGRPTSIDACERPRPAVGRAAARQAVEHVLGDDDRGVHEQPDGDGKAAERHGVDPHARLTQEDAGQADRERDRQGHDERGPRVSQQSEQHRHHEHPAQEHGAAHAAERRPDELRLVVDDAQGHAFRKGAPDGLHRLADARRDLDRVRAELLADAAAHDLAGQPMGETSAKRRRLEHVRNVGQEHGGRPARGDHGAAQVVDPGRAPDRAHAPFRRPAGDEAGRRVLVRAFQGVEDLVQGDTPRGHPVGVELDLELTEVSTERLHGRDARHGQEPIPDLELGEIAQRHEVERPLFRLEGELEDLVQPAGQAGEERRLRCPGEAAAPPA